MSNVKAESPVLDAFESAVAGSQPPRRTETMGCMIASKSSQANALLFADVCTNGFGWSVAAGSEISADVCTR